MKKRVLMVTLSMALVVGLAGIVNAATMGSNTTDTASQAPNESAYVNHSNVSSTGAIKGTALESDQTMLAHKIQELPTQTDQAQPSPTDINTQMKSSNGSMNNQTQNMPIKTQIQTLPMNTHTDGQMNNSQHQQGMSETNRHNQANASSATQQSSANAMMGSTERMGK